MNSRNIDSFALKFSMIGALAMAVLGIVFSLITHSSAILLDGVFSLIFFFVSIVTLTIS